MADPAGDDAMALPAPLPGLPGPLDGWVVPPHTAARRTRGRGSEGRTGAVISQPLVDLVEQFAAYLRKQRGRTEGGVKTYRWNLEQFLVFVRARSGRLARLKDLERPTIQAWIDDMAAQELGLNSLRLRVSTLSSFCAWLIRRDLLTVNPLAQIDRPACQDSVPAVPAPSLMDALVEEAKQRGRPRDLAIFLILRFTGMRRGSVASLRVRHVDPDWGLRAVRVKGGKTQDIPLPPPVIQYLAAYVHRVLVRECERLTPDTPLFWSSWGERSVGRVRKPMAGKNIWRLCKTYGKLIGYPELKPHDLRHGVAVEVLEQRHDLEEVRALLGHVRIDTTQIYTRIRPPQLKRAVAFYDQTARRMLIG
jgi:site-specific recombinase XerD